MIVISVLAIMTLNGAPKETIEKFNENGVEIINNHITPYKLKGLPSEVILKKEFSLDMENFEKEIGYIGCFNADSNGNLYLLDNQLYKILVLNNKGKFLKEMGSKGRGPGEFVAAMDIRINSLGEIVINDVLNRKFSVFSKEGELIKEVKFTFSSIGGIMLDNGNFIFNINKFPTSQKENIKVISYLYNSKFKLIKELYEIETLNPLAEKIIASYNNLCIDISSDKIFIGNQGLDYDIFVFDFSGKLLKKIRKKYTPISPSPEFKKVFIERLGKKYKFFKSKLIFPEFLPPFHSFSSDKAGRLFVLTYEKDTITKSKYMLDIFNQEGVFIYRIGFEYPPFYRSILRTINDRLYFLYEQTTGSQKLICYKIIWKK
jgi:hypothetical protein